MPDSLGIAGFVKGIADDTAVLLDTLRVAEDEGVALPEDKTAGFSPSVEPLRYSLPRVSQPAVQPVSILTRVMIGSSRSAATPRAIEIQEKIHKLCLSKKS